MIPSTADSGFIPELTESVSSSSSGPYLDAVLDGLIPDMSSQFRNTSSGGNLPASEGITPLQPSASWSRRGSQRRYLEAHSHRLDASSSSIDTSTSPSTHRSSRSSGPRRKDLLSDEMAKEPSLVLGRDRLKQLLEQRAIHLVVEHMTLAPRVAADMGSNHVFFVDYYFGVDRDGRLPSARQEGNMVLFSRKTLVPVDVDEKQLQSWLECDIVFTVYAKQRGLQHMQCCARAVMPFKVVLLAEQFTAHELLPVNELNGSNFGHLAVTVQLTKETKESAAALGELHPSSAVLSAPVSGRGDEETAPPSSGKAAEDSDGLSSTFTIGPGPLAVKVAGAPASLTDISGPPGSRESAYPVLHLLLHVSEIHNVAERNEKCVPGKRNLFLVCRVFGPADQSRTEVLWHESTNHFNHRHSEPVMLTPELLKRLENNISVVEVWDRCASADGSDALVGLAKLTLHPFYLAFRNLTAVAELQRGDLPVVAVNEFVPVIDLPSGKTTALLRLLLAMGSRRQVATISRLQAGSSLDGGSMLGPGLSSKDAHSHTNTAGCGPQASSSQAVETDVVSEEDIDHTFEFTISRGKDLQLFARQLHGETDCFVRYRFPTSASTFETVSTQPVLCVPGPNFNGRTLHTIRLRPPRDIQHMLLALNIDGIILELWVRRYYPDIADQMVARGVLPIGKLCRLGTEFKGTVVRTDWSVSLQATSDERNVGTLEGSVSYSAQRAFIVQGKADGEAQVSLHIVRATGLLDAFVSDGNAHPTVEERDLNVLLRAAVLPRTRTASDRIAWVEAPLLYACSAYPDIDCTLALPGTGDFVAVEVWHRPGEQVCSVCLRLFRPFHNIYYR